MKITGNKVSEEQGGFRKGRGCGDQIFLEAFFKGVCVVKYPVILHLTKEKIYSNGYEIHTGLR